MAQDPEDQLFHGVSFTILTGPAIDDEYEEKLIRILTRNGASHMARQKDGSINNIASHTHIITADVDFPEYSRALEYNVHVVRPTWVTASNEKKRQAQPRQHSPDPSMFFRQVIVSCADLPEGDKDAIIAGTLALGGLYSSPLTKLVTHVVALDTENDKCRTVAAKNLDCKIVLPHWFDDCLKLGKLISEDPYLLPDPEILRATSNEPVRARSTPALDGAMSAVAGKPPPYNLSISPSESRKHLAVFRDKKVLFSKDLNINEHLAKTLRHLVTQAGGALTTDVNETDVYIGHYRDGIDYVAASRAEKTVGNLAWFYNVINRNKWTNPLARLLHYPVPRDGIPGFKDMRISLSNYSGEARIYLENLCTEAGAMFTRTMKQDNTHLITAHTHSEKCDAAQEWGIEIVNHLWLEESYAKCAVQPLTVKRYTHFPPRTNLSEVVGQTTIDMAKVRKLYFAGPEKTIKDAEPGAKTPHPFRGAVKAPDTSPLPSSAAVASRAKPSVSSKDVDPVQDSKPAPQTAKKKKTRVGSDAAMSTPSMLSRRTEKEATPPTTGRASKEKALTNLHALKDDILLFEREQRRKGGVVHGGRRTAEPEDEEMANTMTATTATTTKTMAKTRKRKSNDTAHEDAEISDAELGGVTSKGNKAKKAKMSGSNGVAEPDILYTMMVTGDERWLGNAKKESVETNKLRTLGIKLTTDPTLCTLLCAPRILRTKKFIAALANSPLVVSISYLDALLACNSPCSLPPASKHTLKDVEAEERLGFRMQEALVRAKTNSHCLLKGWTVFATEKVVGGFETYREIVSVNGGNCLVYRGRSNAVSSTVKARQEEEEEEENDDDDDDDDDEKQQRHLLRENQGGHDEKGMVYLLSGTSDEEVRLWERFRADAAKGGLVGRVVKTDWLINAAMSQRVEWDDKWELKEGLVPGWSG